MASAFFICLAKNGYCSESEVKKEEEENFIVRNCRSAKEFILSNKEEFCEYFYKVLPIATFTAALINIFYLRNLGGNLAENMNKNINNLKDSIDQIAKPAVQNE